MFNLWDGSEFVYFPDKVFSEREDLNALITERYSKYLIALQEPSLYKYNRIEVKSVFRFTWIRTFDPPVSIRLEVLPNGTAELYSKMTSGAGCCEPGTLIACKLETIEKNKVDSFIEMVKNANFLNLPSNANHEKPDGSHWILESFDGVVYHVVDRWSPDKGAVREIGEYLIKLSGLNVTEIYWKK